MSSITESKIANLKKFIDSHENFYVVGHKEPDGDCVSSSLGIASLLEKLNKKVQLLSAGPFKRPEIKKFEKKFYKSPKKNFTKENTAVIMVDCSEIERIGEDIAEIIKDFDIFIVDHHKTANADEDNSIIYPTSPAAAYLVQQIYEKIIGNPDEELSKTLFFGFCTDTGFFRFLDSDTCEVFEGVSRLVKNGANPRQTYSDINSGKPFSTRKLLGIMLSRAEQYFNGKLIVTYETLEDTNLFGKEGRDSDSLYQLLLSVDGVQAVLFVRQDTDKTCTAGFRSKDVVDVSAIASKFGGGGHKNAAGLSTEGTLDTLLPKIIGEFEKVLS